MFLNISLVILACFVVRLICKSGIQKYVMTGLTNEELHKKVGFNLTVISYILSSVFMYMIGTFFAAFLVKTYIL